MSTYWLFTLSSLEYKLQESSALSDLFIMDSWVPTTVCGTWHIIRNSLIDGPMKDGGESILEGRMDRWVDG
jgi:hypothetical protein